MKEFIIRNKKIFVIVSLSLIVISLLGGTYAMFQRLDKAEYANNYKTGLLQIELDDTSESLGGILDLSGTVPISDEAGTNTNAYKFKLVNKGNLSYKFNLKLVSDVTYLEEHNCLNNQLNYDYIKIKINDNEPVVLSSLTDNIIDKDIILNPGESKYYELRVWLKEGTPNTEIGKHYHAKVSTDGSAIKKYKDDSNANAPVLADGMIPIMYDEESSNWVKADYYNIDSKYAGYDYKNKKWANAVTVTSSTRDNYMNASIGTIIPEDDILAYFVWIPRYKYKLFNATYESGTSPQIIDVVFESETSTTGDVTCTYDTDGNETCTNKVNGKWYTHPAFTFGDTELEGIWVGKYTTTGSDTAPTIKSGIKSLTLKDIAGMYNASMLINSTDYLTRSGVKQVDSHMMKNIEWGAVAYLKQSNYGLGITKLDGCDAKTLTTGHGPTTGNVTGVYDMSGGASELVMGNQGKGAGASNLIMSEIPSQYIDIYAGANANYSHLGDALGETAGWYGEYEGYADFGGTWFARGSYIFMADEHMAGFGFNIFSFFSYEGYTDSTTGFRVVLSVTN